MQDLTVGVRTLVKSPSFAITATLILTFGIGLNLTLFQMMRVGLLRPPALKNVDSLVRFLTIGARQHHQSTVPYPLAQFVKDNNTASGGGAGRDERDAWRGDETPANRSTPRSCRRTGSTSSAMAPCTGACSANRWTARADAPSVVLSATPSGTTASVPAPIVIGTTVYHDRKPVTIAGVAPATFPGLDFNVPDVFVPIAQREYFYPESTLLRAWE